MPPDQLPSGERRSEVPGPSTPEQLGPLGEMVNSVKGAMDQSKKGKETLLDQLAEKMNLGGLSDMIAEWSAWFKGFLEGILGEDKENKKEQGESQPAAPTTSASLSVENSPPTSFTPPRGPALLTAQTQPKQDQSISLGPEIVPFAPVEIREKTQINAEEAVFIGASVMDGFHRRIKGSEFIGKGSESSTYVKNRVLESPDKLKGKKLAIIQGYGNNLYDPERILRDLDDMVEACKKAGIPKIIIVLRLPYGRGLKNKKLIEQGQVAREEILKKFSQDPRVQIADLYTPFMEIKPQTGKDTGFIKTQYDPLAKGDGLHLGGKAYEDSLAEIGRVSGTNLGELLRGKNEKEKPPTQAVA